MPSETQVETAIESQDEEDVDWSEVAEQGGLGEIMASESSADGMALEKIKRHSDDDDNLCTHNFIETYEPMDLDEEVHRQFSGLKQKQPLIGAEDNGHYSKWFKVSQAEKGDMAYQLDLMDMDDSVNVDDEQPKIEGSYMKKVNKSLQMEESTLNSWNNTPKKFLMCAYANVALCSLLMM